MNVPIKHDIGNNHGENPGHMLLSEATVEQ